jgi:hypothetical protein
MAFITRFEETAIIGRDTPRGWMKGRENRRGDLQSSSMDLESSRLGTPGFWHGHRFGSRPGGLLLTKRVMISCCLQTLGPHRPRACLQDVSRAYCSASEERELMMLFWWPCSKLMKPTITPQSFHLRPEAPSIC